MRIFICSDSRQQLRYAGGTCTAHQADDVVRRLAALRHQEPCPVSVVDRATCRWCYEGIEDDGDGWWATEVPPSDCDAYECGANPRHSHEPLRSDAPASRADLEILARWVT